MIEVGNSKISTLKFLSLHCLGLDSAGAIEIINSLGSVKIDFSEGGLGVQYNTFISPQSRITGLDLKNGPYNCLLWWTGMPQYICELDFSSLLLVAHPNIFEKLTQILSSSPRQLSLQSLNISNIVTIPQSIVNLLEVCLLCPMIKLQKLDISGKF